MGRAGVRAGMRSVKAGRRATDTERGGSAPDGVEPHERRDGGREAEEVVLLHRRLRRVEVGAAWASEERNPRAPGEGLPGRTVLESLAC